MAIETALSTPNSVRKRPNYNPNQKINAKTVGSIPGLEDDLVLYPKAIAEIIQNLFNRDDVTPQLFGGQIDSFNINSITTKKGLLLLAGGIHGLQELVLTPTPEAFWGFYEIQLSEEVSDNQTLSFWDAATKSPFQDTAPTRKSYKVSIRENHNSTAAFPTVSSGWIKWISYKKDAAFGDIIEVAQELKSISLPNDRNGLVAMNEDVQALQTEIAAIKPPNGSISGGLLFNSVGLPPKISAGNYEVNGTMIDFNTDQSLALADTLLQSRQSFESYAHYLVCLNNSGQKKYILYGEGAIAGATGNITSITGAGTTKTLSVSSGTFPANAATRGAILVITGNDGVNGVFKVASYISGTSVTFESITGVTGSAVGTWTLYDRINTLHGVGSATAITVDADVGKYTPSLGENGWASGIAAFNPTRNGYHLIIPGLEDYRVLGTFKTGAAGAVSTTLFSYKTGRNKNDNDFAVGNAAYGSTANKILRFSTIFNIYGNDYILIPNDTVNACSLTLKRECDLSLGLSHGTTTGPIFGISLNTSSVTTIFNSLPAAELLGTSHGVTNYSESVFIHRKLFMNDILRPHSDGVSLYSASLQRFEGRVIL